MIILTKISKELACLLILLDSKIQSNLLPFRFSINVQQLMFKPSLLTSDVKKILSFNVIELINVLKRYFFVQM